MPFERTVQDIFDRTTLLLGGKKFSSGQPAAFTTKQGFQLLKDAYDILADSLHAPRATSGIIPPIAGQRKYDLPADCFDGIVLAITFAGVPLVRLPYQEAVDRFGHLIQYDQTIAATPANGNSTQPPETWYSPASVNGIVYWTKEDDDFKFTVINTPTTNDVAVQSGFEIVYVQETPEPTATTDYIPKAYNSSANFIPLYLAGRCLEADKMGRGAALLEEFESRVLKRKARFNRVGRRTASEAYTQDMNAYRKNYKGKIGWQWR